MKNLYDEFVWRGLVYDATEGLAELFANESVTAYIGFDPTASSLHVGSLLTAMGLARLQRFGHTPIAIVGGGTGMIGDPSGKSQERQLLSREQIDENVAGIRQQLSRFLDFDAPGNAARIVNNADWLAAFDLLGFLRDTGKYFTVNAMLQKESVNRRLESEEGICTRNSAICCCRRVISSSCSIATAARCRWAAAISGATSRPASI